MSWTDAARQAAAATRRAHARNDRRSDIAHLKRKGYTAAEIKQIHANDAARGVVAGPSYSTMIARLKRK